jgi:hypothetical protein
MAAAAANMIIQTRWDRLVTALLSGLLDVYATIRRATSRTEAPDFYGWDLT